MKTVSAGLKAHLALETTTLATCCKVTRTDGVILRTTDHDVDIIISGWTSGEAAFNGTYQAARGYQGSNVESNLDLSVDNLELVGALTSPSITEADLLAGLWDFAALELFVVNWKDLTQGRLSLRSGWLGEISTKRGTFVAEVRGLAQAYTRTLGELTSPSCRATLGDARCKKAIIAPFFVVGTLAGVSADGLTFYDGARTEPGPAGGVTIVSISNHNPARVTLAAGTGAQFANLQTVMISGAAGGAYWPAINGQVQIENLSGDQFDLAVDSTSFGAYTASSGTCTPLGGESGYFDLGLMTMTSGAALGFSQEIRSYVPGQWTLELPFPYTPAPGDFYELRAGCDKAYDTCKTKFDNIINFRGEPFLPGLDRLQQIGKQK